MLQTLLFFLGFVWFPIELAVASSSLSSSWSSTTTATTATPSSSSAGPKDNNPLYSIRLPGQPFETSWEEAADEHDDEDRPIKSKGRSWLGAGREFNLFDSRGGSNEGGDGLNDDEADALDGGPSATASSPETATTTGGKYRRPSSPHPYASSSSSGSAFGGNYFQRRSSSSPARQRPFSFSSDQGKTNNSRRKKPELFQTVQDWWTTSISPNVQSWPKIQCRVEPTTTLKIRKTFRLGADFNTQRGVWQFKSSWEDDIIGGKLTLAGKELQLTKSWQLSVGKYTSKTIHYTVNV
jgi:hypothetical protein